MSDHDAAPDPMDKAYAQAEALLSDDADRAARRARVLAAARAASSEVARPARRPAWRRGGWLVAASVAGLTVVVANQIRPPVPIERPAAPAAPTRPAVPAQERSNAPPAAAEGPPEAPVVAPPAVADAPEAAAREIPGVEPPPQAAQAPPPPPSPPAAAAAAPAADQGVSELVVTGSRVEAARKAPRAASSAGSPGELAERLRDAAALGRTADVAALLAKGAPVDDPDDEGETALMKSVQANHAAVAALLRRHGADLDRKNRAGDSARDMAKSVGDAELDRALGPES